jgi:hypothetical protein
MRVRDEYLTRDAISKQSESKQKAVMKQSTSKVEMRVRDEYLTRHGRRRRDRCRLAQQQELCNGRDFRVARARVSAEQPREWYGQVGSVEGQ